MLTRFLDRLSGPAFVLLRVVAGLNFAFHGMQKLWGYQFPAEYIPKVGTQGWIGAVIEVVTGLLITAGLFTRWAAFVASGTMAVAYTQFHWKLKFGAQFFPVVNQGELALIFCVLFFYVACRGAGPASVDGVMGRK